MNYCGNCFKEYPGSGPCPHCGHNPAEDVRRFPQALRAGSVLDGRYIVGRPLGQGGFGITYKAMDYDTQQLVAIKEFMPSSIVFRDSSQRINAHSELMLEDFNRAKADFLSEAKTLSQFNGLDNICDIYSYFEENGTAYFAMEYADGMPLDSYVKKQGKPLSFEQARDILLPVMEALGHVHEKGIVHRDISPDNIILRPDGRAMLIDFGAARYSAGEKTKSLTVVLKHGFAPKEQYTRRGKQGPFTDVYALAATMYWLICGKVPPEAIDRFTNDELVAPSKLGIKIPPKAERALLKALAVDENQRYKSMKDFAAALRPDAAKPKPEPKKKPETQPKPKSRRGILIAAVCTLALICIAVFGLKSAPPEPWSLDDSGTLYINDPMADYSTAKDAPWFDQREKIKAVVISDNVSQIRNYAFYCCTSLESAIIPDSVTEIGDSAFAGCSALESVTIPDSVKTIYKDAFRRCTKLKSVAIPDSVVRIDSHTFYGCSSLESVVISGSLSVISDYAFSGCKTLKSVTIPDSVTQIGSNAFFGCTSLESLVIPDSITEIKDYAFSVCTALKSVTIPDSVTKISAHAFAGCSTLESLVIPSSVTEIGDSAFSGCYSLKSVSYSGSETQWGLIRIGSDNTLLNKNAQFSFGDSVLWQLRDNGTLYLLEPMDDFSRAEDAPWHDRRDEITYIVVTESVTEIPSYAFRGCTSLKSAIIPDSVTRIGDSAFAGCSALDSLSIVNSVTEIGDSAFRSCSSLRTVELPAALGEIKTNTFNSCISLESVTIPVSVTEIASAAFGACSKLKDVYYTGTQEQWNQVNVTTTPWQDNMIYTDATFHFLN